MTFNFMSDLVYFDQGKFDKFNLCVGKLIAYESHEMISH